MAVKKNNAIIAKTRAVFGKRLTVLEYNELLACQTVNDVASYLRDNTEYRDIFEGKSDTVYHRGKLEIYLRERLFKQYAVLCKYDLSNDIKFFRTVIVHGEIEQLLHCVRLLKFGHPEEYLFILPDFFNHHTKLDLYKIAQIKSYKELIEATSNTVYSKILSPFLNDSDTVEFTAVENALYNYYYSFIHAMIERHTSGSLHSELKKIFGMRADLHNIAHIMRLKKYYNASPDYIRSLIIPYRHSINNERLEYLINAESADEVFDYLKKSKYGLSLENYPFIYIEDTVRHIEYNAYKRMLRLTANSVTALAAYIFLAEVEMQNLINIIEGIRYGLPPSEIYNLLVGVS